MRLNRLTLSNFRCFPSLEIALHPRLTVLVAENGQGKSSVLDALRIALWPFVSSFDLASSGYNDPANGITIKDVRLQRMPDGSMSRCLPTRLEVRGDYGAGAAVWKRYRESEKANSKTRSDANTRRMEQWAADLQQRIRDPQSDPQALSVFGYYGTGRLWSEKKLTKSQKARDETQDMDFYIRTFAYRDCLDPASTYKHFKAWFIWASESYQEQRLKELDRRADPLLLQQAQQRVQAVREAIDSFLRPATGWHSLEYSVSQEKSLVLRHDEYGILNADQLSDGIRSVLAMIGDIAYRCIKLNPHLGQEAARQTCGVVLIDEVDMHLHPRWQQVILAQLIAAFPRIQFIVTTHSPQVLTTVSRDNIRILEAKESSFEASKPDFSPLAHESGDALAKVMGTQREPELPLQDDIRRYEQLVRTGQEDSADAQQLRGTLENAGYQFHDSDLATWRFLAARKSGKAG